jgi:hypothetical protein
MPVPTATIDGGSANAARMTRAMESEKNPPFVFTGNANLLHKPEYYVRIFNVGDMEHRIERPWVNFNPAHRARMIIIPACEAGEKYSKPFIIQDVIQVPVYSLGQGEFSTRGVDGRFLAQDAIHPEDPHGNWRTLRPINQGMASNEGTNLYRWGVFWTTNEIPAEDELKTAKTRQEEFYNHLIEEAKTYWMAGPEARRQIGNTHRRAASYFSLEFEWNQVYKARMECPGCGTSIPQTAVICFKCPATFNWQKALDLGLRTVKQAIEAGMLEPQAEEMAKKPTKKKPKPPVA